MGEWKLVPVEPTRDMISAFLDANIDHKDARARYNAMIAASPTPSLPEDAARVVERLRDAHHMTQSDGLGAMLDTAKEAAALILSLSSQLADRTDKADAWDAISEKNARIAELERKVAVAKEALEPTEAMIIAAQAQISEGIGAYLRKFTDSLQAIRARELLHQMPESEWTGMTRMLAEEAVGAALSAKEGR